MAPPLSVRLRNDHFGNSGQVSAPLHVLYLCKEARLLFCLGTPGLLLWLIWLGTQAPR